MSEKLVLYQLEACPYCKLVRRKLEVLGLSYEVRSVPPRREDRKEVQELSGQSAVPVLVHGEKVVYDSAVILQYLDEQFGPEGGSGPLPGQNYGMRVEVKGGIGLEDLKAITLEALKEEAFGVLTEIDVKATLKKKLGVDVPEQLILGACNPQMAHKAMEMEPDLGLLLPCNVVIRQNSEGGYLVSAIHPLALFGVVARDDMIPLAAEVKSMLGRALEKIAARVEQTSVS
ncbi:MAG: DUF302 domain-containing protein [Planctomycetota bacterium]|nr:MAG: DUF302 domain-containing protein [Planctomycetota bacterium]